MNIPATFFTIGHSTRSLDEFVRTLQMASVRMVVDVRTIPRSWTNPQYNQDVLPSALAAYDIHYAHLAALGGRRGKSKDVAPEVNAFWRNQSFHNYADYALSDDFRAGFDQLRALGHQRACVIMCAEAVWWRCHRRIITDYLLSAGEDVFHLFGPDHAELGTLTPAAVAGDGMITYPRLEG